jgi:hypothetical protein
MPRHRHVKRLNVSPHADDGKREIQIALSAAANLAEASNLRLLQILQKRKRSLVTPLGDTGAIVAGGGPLKIGDKYITRHGLIAIYSTNNRIRNPNKARLNAISCQDAFCGNVWLRKWDAHMELSPLQKT